MVPELEKMQKPRITEIQVRMDCNGCVQKIKKALHGINGIYDLYIDFPQQKLTIIGWVDPEKIVKAIKKTRKIATICSHIEPSDPPTQPAEPAPAPAPAPEPPEGGQPPAPDAANPPPTETPPAAAAPPPAEPPKDPPPPENPAPEVTPSPVAAETAATQQPHHHHHHGPKDIEEIHIIHHHPPQYGHGYSYGGHWSNYPSGQGFRPEPPVYVTQSYDTYKPSPSITAFEFVRSPPQHTRYSRPENYSEDYHNRGNSNGNNITSMFSDENPNACRIV